MTEKNAPNISRYECSNANDGYNWILIDNQESETVYKEKGSYSIDSF
jgi:hypothetical protein